MKRGGYFPRQGGLLLAALLLSGCEQDDPNHLLESDPAPTTCPPSEGETATGTGSETAGASSGGGVGGASAGANGDSDGLTAVEVDGSVLADRVLSYTEALRTAAFKLVGNAPTYKQIHDLETSPSPMNTYTQLIDQLMTDKRFAAKMVAFWQNTLRTANPPGGSTPSLDTAPVFAARLLVDGEDMTQLFTQASNTCPSFDPATGLFSDGDCVNNSETAGILTNPGLLAHYYGNFAFSRNRLFQEVFACNKQPAEGVDPGVPLGPEGYMYSSPWPFYSIAGEYTDGAVNFTELSATMCANCHSTANHRAILWATYDSSGNYVQPAGTDFMSVLAVPTPVANVPLARNIDFLPPGEGPAWKFGHPVQTLTEMGAEMAVDAEVQRCFVLRAYDYLFSKGDPVYDQAEVPQGVLEPHLQTFVAEGFNLRATIRAILLSDDFLRF